MKALLGIYFVWFLFRVLMWAHSAIGTALQMLGTQRRYFPMTPTRKSSLENASCSSCIFKELLVLRYNIVYIVYFSFLILNYNGTFVLNFDFIFNSSIIIIDSVHFFCYAKMHTISMDCYTLLLIWRGWWLLDETGAKHNII